MKSLIVITTTSFGEYDPLPINKCKEAGYDVVLNPYKRKIGQEELLQLAASAVGLVAGTEPLTGEVLSKLPQLRVISRCGVGLENVDLEAAKRLRIKVFNTPDGPTMAVAELTVGLLLNLLRKVNNADTAVKNGRWEKPMGNLLSGKQVGIIGFGRIGREVAKLLLPFGCVLTYADLQVQDPVPGVLALSKKELLERSDVILIHAATKEEIIGRREFEIIKKGAWLINMSRGGAVNEELLYERLVKGDLAGTALDVFVDEPYVGPLRGLKNVILTPHIGSYAREARVAMEIQSIENLLKGLKGD
ncbi:MAG: phosphoglycerate dehydrogenase [Candidatus Omnitrophica bacterium]|nr:phosphoglycerate dehydrogenase [Candidatus Omnitrophota bacterium]